MAGPTRITVLISGNGTNLQAVIDAIKDGKITNAEIVRVISNRVNAFGLQRAQNAGLPTLYHNLKRFREQHPEYSDDLQARENYDKALAGLVLADQPNLVVCAGWMHVVSSAFLDSLAAASIPAINLHPALPGAFNGINAIERAHKAFQEGTITRTGCMIHYVVAEVDAGRPLVIEEADILQGETCAQLEERMHKVEWRAIVQGVQLAIKNLQHSSGEVSGSK
ncbi:MAG: hypothetical protein Q9174_000686 [Haloplaca sp. 1 TL-2023]